MRGKDGLLKRWDLTLAAVASAAVIAVALVIVATRSPSPARSPARDLAKSHAGSLVPAGLAYVPVFGANPGKLGMYLYVPRSVRPDPAILAALHGCDEDGVNFYNGTGFSTLADEYGLS